MASAHLYGLAELEADVGVYTIVHALAVPLMISPAWGFTSTRRRQRWEAWTADGSQREVFVLGQAVHEIQALVRFENEPEQLRSILVAGLEEDATLLYRPHGPLGEEYPLKLLAAGGAPGDVTLKPDRERFALGEWEVALVLRRVDGGDLEQLLVPQP